jgi:hypothetical protein
MLSKITYTLCVALMCYASFIFYPAWKNKGTESAIAWDVAGYYWYLPSVFIYKDLKHQSFSDSIINKYGITPTFPGFQTDNSNYVLKYSSGMAIMYLPFFTVAHFLAGPFGYPQDGFSTPYQLAIQIGGLLAALIGLWYLRKLLLLFYNDTVVSIVLFALAFGSNFLNCGALGSGMSHCWLFTVYVFLILNTIHFYRQPSYKYAARIGLLTGLAVLTRPTEIIACLIPLLWGMENLSITGIKQRIAFFSTQIKKMLLTIICAFLVISIQLVYWKYVSGHWLVYSYQDQGFSWLFQNIFNYTLSFRTGWLIYCPMLFFAFIGIIPFIKRGCNKVAILVFFLLNYYIVSSWDIWWYSGRAMIQSYPILMFPFAALADVTLKSKKLKWILTPFFLLFVYLNFWATYHYHKGDLFDTESMTKEYFLRVAGRWSAPEETKKLRDTRELFEGTPKNMQLLYTNDLEKDTDLYCPLPAINGKKSICLDKAHKHSQKYSFPYSSHQADWVRGQATFRCTEKEWSTWKMPRFNIFFMGKGNVIKAYGIRVHRFLDNGQTKDIFFDIKVPPGQFDAVGVELDNSGSDKALLMDDIKVYSFNE